MDLRRTAPPLAMSAGERASAAQNVLGHESAVMTFDSHADLLDRDGRAVVHPHDQLISVIAFPANAGRYQ